MSGAVRAVRMGALALLGLSLACANPLWEQPPPQVREAPIVRPGSLTRSTLSNGLQVLVLEDRRLPLVSIGVAVRRGAGAELPDGAGLASFTAEMMNRGAGDRDARALAEFVDAMGADLDVSSGWDSTAVTLSGLSRDLDPLFEVLSDVVRRPRFETAEAERARGEQLAALEQAKDDPGTLVAWHMARALYPDHRYGLPSPGSPESVKKLTATSARDFHGRIFVPNDAILFATGDVSAETVMAQARRRFEDWKRAADPDAGPPPPNPAPAGGRRVVVVDRPDLGQAQIAIAHEGIARSFPDRIAAALMNSVVGGGGFSSRLMDVLRAEAGLTYGVWSGFSMRRQPGPFQVSTFTRVAETRRAVDMVLAELSRARQSPPSEEELTRARTLAVGSFSLSLETSDAVMGGLIDLEIYDLPDDSLDTYRARVRATTQAMTAEMARDLLHPERAAIVVVGPADQLVPLLEGLGPIEVVQP